MGEGGVEEKVNGTRSTTELSKLCRDYLVFSRVCSVPILWKAKIKKTRNKLPERHE